MLYHTIFSAGVALLSVSPVQAFIRHPQWQNGQRLAASSSASTSNSPAVPSNPPSTNAVASTENANCTTNSNSTAKGGKKGAGTWASPGISSAVTQLGASWAYSWGPTPSQVFTDMSYTPPTGVDLIPMLPGFSSHSTSALQQMLTSNTAATAVLGWNEPDASGSGAINASAAAALWLDIAQAITAAGKKVGSPAPTHTSLQTGDWFVEFMSTAAPHADFIALHSYSLTFTDVDGAVADLKSYIQAVYAKYGNPVWLTEFAMVDYSDPAEGKTPDQAVQVDFLTKACDMLEGLEAVERSAWFAVPQSDAQPATNLVDKSGVINGLG